mmetsp:Transcript_16883/g.33726  ORF Transcript_16883/g.33726 Transcript_16883/m.33726 type:complete len:317 (-) Transcript_16883:1904-2854(-)
MSSFASNNPSNNPRDSENLYEDNPSASPTPSPPPLPTSHGSFAAALNAASAEGLEALLAIDVRLCESKGGKGLQGKEAVLSKLQTVSAKMSTLIQDASAPGTLLRSGRTTVSLLTLKKGMITMTVGLRITWYGHLAAEIVLQKGAKSDFLADDTAAPSASPSSSSSSSFSSTSPRISSSSSSSSCLPTADADVFVSFISSSRKALKADFLTFLLLVGVKPSPGGGGTATLTSGEATPSFRLEVSGLDVLGLDAFGLVGATRRFSSSSPSSPIAPSPFPPIFASDSARFFLLRRFLAALLRTWEKAPPPCTPTGTAA